MVVFNDAGQDDTPEQVPRLFAQKEREGWSGLRYVHNSGPNVQIAAARKRLTEEADPGAEFLLYQDDDAVLHPACLRILVDYMQGHPQAWAAGPRIQVLDSQETAHAANFVHPWTGRYASRDSDAPLPCDWLNSTCLLVRRRVMSAIEGFTASFHTAHEEVNFCLQIRERGGQVVYVPEAVAFHEIDLKETKRDRLYYLYRNKILLIQRRFKGAKKSVALFIALFFGLPRYILESLRHHRGVNGPEWRLIFDAVRHGFMNRDGKYRKESQ